MTPIFGGVGIHWLAIVSTVSRLSGVCYEVEQGDSMTTTYKRMGPLPAQHNSSNMRVAGEPLIPVTAVMLISDPVSTTLDVLARYTQLTR
ncbi:hypothetical protein JB92DRAFT_3005503 [Gautieria morchelliformis]|nr:hypothetical protein JB92DRAFT_3005503 [Gautieria morchelliformis]